MFSWREFKSGLVSAALGALGIVCASSSLQAQAAQPAAAAGAKPNIVVIMGDDIGIWNIGAYHRGMMAGRTPNLDKLAKGGMLFTDYYAEASCTAGRANFITGQLPIRTGMTTVGQAGSKIGMPAAAPTIMAPSSSVIPSMPAISISPYGTPGAVPQYDDVNWSNVRPRTAPAPSSYAPVRGTSLFRPAPSAATVWQARF